MDVENMEVDLDSGFGFPLPYPVLGSIKIVCTIPKEDDRIILLEYPRNGQLRKVLRSQTENESLDRRTMYYIYGMSATIDSGICDTDHPLYLELYS